MWPDDEKAAENTCCIVKDFEEVWAHFCPSKPCLPLLTDTSNTGNNEQDDILLSPADFHQMLKLLHK